MIFTYFCLKAICEMYISETKIRVRYAEADRMGYAYYSHYSTWFEVARVEALRELGIAYKQLEDRGILLPVKEYRINFHKPAYYDDELLIKTYIKEIPAARFRFEYKVFNEKEELISEAETTLVFIDKKTGKPCRADAELLEKLKAHIRE